MVNVDYKKRQSTIVIFPFPGMKSLVARMTLTDQISQTNTLLVKTNLKLPSYWLI